MIISIHLTGIYLLFISIILFADWHFFIMLLKKHTDDNWYKTYLKKYSYSIFGIVFLAIIMMMVVAD
jgi:hypothetical protein